MRHREGEGLSIGDDDLYTSVDTQTARREPSTSSRRRGRGFRVAAAVVAAFACGVAADAAVLHLGSRRAAQVVIGQRLIRPLPPARTLPRHPTTTIPVPSLAWGPPFLLDGSAGLESVSCATVVFCAAVDSQGQAFLYQHSQWTAPSTIDPNVQLNDVSCPTSLFCLAVDQNGQAVTYNGTVWSRPVQVDRSAFREITSISCPTPTFCAAADGNGNVLTYNGKTWSAPQQVDPQGWSATSRDIATISCPADDFCAGIDTTGSAFYYLNQAWQPASSVSPSASTVTVRLKNSVSCSSSLSCVATENPGGIAAYNGTDWSFPVIVDENNFISSVSCPTATFCAAVDGLLPQGFGTGTGTGQVLTYNGIDWSAAPEEIDPGGIIQSITCPAPDFCVAVDQTGHAIIGTGVQP